MSDHRKVATCRRNWLLAAATRSLIFMLVFCFAGCAAGSCLSYGHSCWGAHGKRSGNSGNNGVRPLPVHGIPDDGDRSIALPSAEDQWIISRLVTRQLAVPSSGKLRVKWYDASKVKMLPRTWIGNDDAVSENSNTFRRRESDDEDEDEENEGEMERKMVIPREILAPQDDSDEVLLVPPPNEHLKPAGQSHKLRLFKILNSAAGNLK